MWLGSSSRTGRLRSTIESRRDVLLRGPQRACPESRLRRGSSMKSGPVEGWQSHATQTVQAFADPGHHTPTAKETSMAPASGRRKDNGVACFPSSRPARRDLGRWRPPILATDAREVGARSRGRVAGEELGYLRRRNNRTACASSPRPWLFAQARSEGCQAAGAEMPTGFLAPAMAHCCTVPHTRSSAITNPYNAAGLHTNLHGGSQGRRKWTTDLTEKCSWQSAWRTRRSTAG